MLEERRNMYDGDEKIRKKNLPSRERRNRWSREAIQVKLDRKVDAIYIEVCTKL